jgi:hypothetical protein
MYVATAVTYFPMLVEYISIYVSHSLPCCQAAAAALFKAPRPQEETHRDIDGMNMQYNDAHT